jgi:hypothetical protein
MNSLKKIRSETQAAMSHLLLRALCLLIIEYECIVSLQPIWRNRLVIFNSSLASIFVLGFIITIINRRIGLIIGMSAGIFNIIVKIIIVISGHVHYPYWPIVWITQSAMVTYFCYRALKAEAIHVE